MCSKKNSQSNWFNVKINNIVCLGFPPANTDMPLQKMCGYSFTCHIWRFLWTNPCMDPCLYMSLGLIRANVGKRQNPKKQRTWTQWRLWRTLENRPRLPSTQSRTNWRARSTWWIRLFQLLAWSLCSWWTSPTVSFGTWQLDFALAKAAETYPEKTYI